MMVGSSSTASLQRPSIHWLSSRISTIVERVNLLKPLCLAPSGPSGRVQNMKLTLFDRHHLIGGSHYSNPSSDVLQLEGTVASNRGEQTLFEVHKVDVHIKLVACRLTPNA